MRLARPAAVWSLALLYLAGAFAALSGAAFPMSPDTPRTVLLIVGVKSLLLALSIFWLGRRLPVWGVHLLLSTSVVTMTVVVSNAATLGGAVTASFIYVCVVIYTAHFTGRLSALSYAAAGSASFGVGLLLAGLPGALSSWIFLVLMTFTLALVMSNLVTRLQRQALVDPLTGALNRSGFVAAAEDAMRVAARSGQPLSVVVLDLDGFKAINDAAGHAEGDRVLKGVTDEWRAALRPSDRLARLGGDEFAALLPGVSSARAHLVAERLTRGIGISCSAGVSQRRSDDGIDALLARADEEMYRVKASRRPGGTLSRVG